MSKLPVESDAALEPVRQALRSAAEKQAEELRGSACRQADALLDAARNEAKRILAEAAREGEAAANAEAAVRSSRVRREAHELVLTLRNSLLQELRRRSKENASHLQDDPPIPHAGETLDGAVHGVARTAGRPLRKPSRRRHRPGGLAPPGSVPSDAGRAGPGIHARGALAVDPVAARKPGRVVRVNGPLVEIEGMDGLSMLELAAVGPGTSAPRL